MASVEQYAQWLVNNQDKKGTPDFETVANAYRSLRSSSELPAPAVSTQPAGFSFKDLATAFGQGAVGSTEALANVVGAGNVASQYLGDVSQALGKQYTPERQAEMQRQKERMQQAEKTGSTWEEVKAGLQNIYEAPLQSAAQGLGSFIPYLPAMLLGPETAAAIGLGKSGMAAFNAVSKLYAPVLGTAQGAGSVKGAIYDAVYKAEKESGLPEEEARRKADDAQSYAGKNLDQIALGGGLGYVASRGGIEKFLTKEGREKAGEKALLPRVGGAMLEETLTEGAQGGQERLAQNIALQRTGRDVPTFQGVAGQAAQEAIIGGLTAGPVSAISGGAPEVKPPPTETEPEVKPEAAAYKPAPSLTGTDAATLLEEQAKGTAGTDLLAGARERKPDLYRPEPSLTGADTSSLLQGSPTAGANLIAAAQERQAEQDRIEKERQAEIQKQEEEKARQQAEAQQRARAMPGMVGADTTSNQLIAQQRENQKKEEAAAVKAKEAEYRKILATTYSADPLQNFRQQQAALERLGYQKTEKAPRSQTFENKPAAPVVPEQKVVSEIQKAEFATEERGPTLIQRTDAFGKQIGAVRLYQGAIQGRVNLPATKAAKEGNFQGVVSALEKSKSPIVAEIAKRSKNLGTKIVIDSDATETYTGPSSLMRQMSIDGAKMHLDALEKIRALAPQIDALPANASLDYGVSGASIKAIDNGADAGTISLKNIADNGNSMFAPFSTGPIKLRTKEDFKALQKAFEDITSEVGEENLRLTSTGSAQMLGVAGAYDADTDTIRVSEYSSKKEEVLAHEIVHAQTIRSIANPTNRQKPIVARLNKLYEHVKKELKEKASKDKNYRTPYGLASIQEFVAEGMANPKFQFELREIKYENTSAWDSFVQTIANLIGVKRDTAFTELLSIYSELTPPASKEVKRTATTKISTAKPTELIQEEAAEQKPMLSLRGKTEGQVKAFEQTLRNLLNKFGLNQVGLNLIEGMRDEGSYAAQLIRVAADAANPIRTLRHESIHALRELGFFTDAQWKSLSNMAKNKWIDQYLKQRNVDGKPLKAGEESRYDAYMREYKGDMEKITEEAVADAFADFDATKPPAGMLQALLNRLRSLFQAIKSALTKVESAEQIFGKVEKGELKAGAREVKGEAKSLRDRATANFKRWFGDSKVVDKDGDPLVVYHATTGNFTEFKPGGNDPTLSGAAMWFTDSKEKQPAMHNTASRQEEYREGTNVMPVYLRIERPLLIDDKTSLEWAQSVFAGGSREFPQLMPPKWVAEVTRDNEYDGIIFDGPALGWKNSVREYIVFKPNQIKSAIGNNGEYSLTDDDIRKSLRSQADKAKEKAQQLLQKRQPINKEALADVDPEYIERLGKVFNPQSKTIIDKIDGMKDGFWRRAAQGIADQYRTIKDYDMRSYMLARMSKTQDGALEGLMFHGHVFNDDGALNIKKNTKGLMEALKPVGNETDRYMMWIALNRESNLPDKKKSPELTELAKEKDQLSQGMLNGKPRIEVYKSVQRDMNALNKSVLDVALNMGLINSSKREIAELESRTDMSEKKKAERIEYLQNNPGAYERFTSDIFYIPFYKAMEDGDIESAVSSAGLTSQKFSAELKGMSDKPFGDLMENTLRNWSHILSASMKNQAANSTVEATMKAGATIPNLKAGLAYEDGKVISTKTGEVVGDGKLRPEYTESGKGMVKIMKDGHAMYFEVLDPMLLDSITSIGYMGPKSKFLDVARDFKNMLQFGVTVSPIFKTNNLIRDSISSMAVSDLKKNPFANVVEGWGLAEKNNPAHIEALAGGAIFNFGSTYEGDQAKLVKRLLKQGVKSEHILDTKDKIEAGLKGLWEKYQELGNKSEAANRLALYKQLRDGGMSHLEAAFNARDLMDFSMQGSWPAFRTVTMVVPFLNARVQGLYKLGRDGIMPTSRVLYNTITGKPIDYTDKQKAYSFGLVTTSVALASMALYMAFKDDEDFKKRDEWDRDNFWWIKLPNMDYALRVPKPFEIGAFGTMTERILEQILDQGAEGKTFGDSISRMLFDTFAMNPVPQMFKPLLDLYANKDSFTGAPIESAGMERLSKQERMTDTTSPLAQALGGMTSILGEKGELSPVQVDYAIKAYFGWLGAMASTTSMYATMPFREGEYPDTNWMDKASLGLVRTLPSNLSKYTTAFYDADKEITQAYADMRHYAEIGDAEKVQEILAEKGDKIALNKLYDKTAKSMANVRKQIRLVTNDPNLDGATKKEQIDQMKQLISMYAEQAENIRKSMK